ncbi:hypothetical protein C0993_000388 [Termitomyces sp. T159_Od127]|nr:hypothetical protein C0993_000388 [Termitomyces sp. T159_Od127]
MMNDMPPLVDGSSAEPTGGGSIHPSPDAHYEQAAENNSFPGLPSMYPSSYWPPLATPPVWSSHSPVPPPPWVSYSHDPQHGTQSPYSHPTPAPSYGEVSPASEGIDTSGGGYEHTHSQPIAASPYFNAGGESFVPMERTHSQDWTYPHSPGFYVGGTPLMRSLSADLERRRRVQQAGVGQQWVPDRYDTTNLARRPTDFRVDYESRRRLFPFNRLYIYRLRYAKDNGTALQRPRQT